MGLVTVYTTDRCGLCVGAKELLEQRGIEYREVNLSRDPDGREQLQRLTGMFTFPQIMIGERPAGGFKELLQADREGTLSEFLQGLAA
jgi:glutaredoxin 3